MLSDISTYSIYSAVRQLGNMPLPFSSSDNDYENDTSDQIPWLNTKFDLSDRVTTDILKMLREGSFNDVCIKLHDGEIKANKFVLAARCEYFAATFRWKDNNNHEEQEVIINDCSKKIMTRIIEYIFSGILQAKDLKLLEFLELKDQVRKMFPGDKLEGQIEDLLKSLTSGGGLYSFMDKDNHFSKRCSSLALPPTDKEIVKALSLVETGNLQPQVLVESSRAIESFIMEWRGGERFEENTLALENLVSHGVIESVPNLKLDLRKPPGNHLQALLQCVTGTVDIRIYNGLEDYNLETLLDAVNCKELHLNINILNQEETEALASAMTSRIETLHLSVDHMFHMDYDAFSKYKGDGKCTEVHIYNHPDNYLSPLLDSVNIKELHLFSGSTELNQDETEALVRALTSRVEILHLGGKDEDNKNTVTLDFDTLKMYKGDGMCRSVHCNSVCIGWSKFDTLYEYCDFDEDDHENLISCSESYVYGMKDMWLNEEGAENWAGKMNWDLRVKNQDCEFVLSRK